jgi:hypothetical protein
MRKRIGIIRNRLSHWLLLLIVVFSASCTTALEAKPESLKLPTRVLFVGNSYMYYNDSLHNHVKRVIKELHPDIAKSLAFKSATIGGARLKHHNIAWLLNHEAIGVDQPFEVVILQGGSSEVLQSDAQGIYQQTVEAYSELVRQSGAQPFLYMTPAYVPPHSRAKPGLIDVISDTVMAAASNAGIPVIPVGLAFEEAYKRKPEMVLHKDFDGSHPSLYGTYLAACVVYLSLYGGSLESLAYDYFGSIEPEAAEFLRGVASDVVRDFTKTE